MLVKADDAIHLQGIGLCPAKPASQFKVGEVMRWNYDFHGTTITEIRQVSPQYLLFTLRSNKDGGMHERRMKGLRLVAYMEKTR
jgi:hypothetical protein